MHQLVQLHQAVLLLAIVLAHSILLLLLVVWLVPSLLEWLVVSLIETSNEVCHRRVEVGIRVMGACGGSATSVGDVTAFVFEVSMSGGGTRGSSKVNLVLRLLGVSGSLENIFVVVVCFLVSLCRSLLLCEGLS